MRPLAEIISVFNQLSGQHPTPSALSEIFAENESYAVRYQAGLCLGMDKKSLDNAVNQWMPGILSDLSSEDVVREEYWEPQHGLDPGYGREVLVPSKRVPRVRDLGDLYSISGNYKIIRTLQRTFWFNDHPSAVTEAAKQLGYRPWVVLLRRNATTVAWSLFFILFFGYATFTGLRDYDRFRPPFR